MHPSVRGWAVAIASAGLYVAAGRASGVTGLTLSIAATPLNHNILAVRHVDTIDPRDIDAVAGRPAGITAVWQGVWDVAAGPRDLRLESHGRSSWTIDDAVAIETTPGAPGAVTRTVWLAAGFHRVRIQYDAEQAERRLIVAAAPTGQPPRQLSPATLKPKLPRYPRLYAAASAMRTALGWLTLFLLLWAARTTGQELTGIWRRRFSRGTPPGPSTRLRAGRALAWAALAGILAYGALLRIDAITARYGPVTSPRWLAAVQTRSIAAPTAIRPASIVWQPEPLFPHRDEGPTHYRSDPYIYLDDARKMTAFYGAHFREPVFPFVTKMFLGVLGGQDVAVSFASTFFSLLAVWLTYVLGAAVWSRPAGLLAALGLSLDFDVVSLASLGWRDDAYMAAFTLCAYLMLRLWRTADASPRVYRVKGTHINAVYLEAVVLGVGAGLAILTRIMAVPFLVAGGAWILLVRRNAWRMHLAAAGLALLTATLTAGPYFVNCWRVYGDPLYTFNVHGAIYSVTEGQAEWKGSTASYVGRKIAQRPIEMIHTVFQGLTSYPFTNKWRGLDAWMTGLGEWASLAALAGLVILAVSAPGRLLLIVMVTSLLPFSLTWTVDPDYRFTVFVYPMLLIAAAVACDAAVRGVRAVLLPGVSRTAMPWRVTAWRPWAATLIPMLVVLWFVTRVSPSLVFADALRNGQDAMVTAGGRDGAAFLSGWSAVVGQGNVRSRVVLDEAVLSIRLPDEADYPATLRMDPFPRPPDGGTTRLPSVELALNGSPVATIPLRWTPGRVGSYDVVLPRAAVRRGANRLVLRVARLPATPSDLVHPGLTDGAAVALWYLRVHPAAPKPGGQSPPGNAGR